MKDEILSTVRRWAAKGLQPSVRALDEDEPDPAARKRVLSDLEATGILRLPFPEDLGGAGPDLSLLGAVLAALSEVCAGTATAVWAHYSALLPFLASPHGARVIKAVSEKSGVLLGSGHISRHTLTAGRNAGGIFVTGRINFLWGVPGASFFLVSAQSEGEGVFSLVSSEDNGVSIEEKHKRIGLRCCRSSSVVLNGVSLDPRLFMNLPLLEYEKVRETSWGTSLGLLGAVACGNAQGAFARALAYAGERYQGGDMLINHTLIQGMLGEMLAATLSAKALTDRALQGLPSSGAWRPSLAKAWAARAGEKVCSDAMQVLGGYGYMRDFGIEKRLRDAKMLCTVGEGYQAIVQKAVRDIKGREEGIWD